MGPTQTTPKTNQTPHSTYQKKNSPHLFPKQLPKTPNRHVSKSDVSRHISSDVPVRWLHAFETWLVHPSFRSRLDSVVKSIVVQKVSSPPPLAPHPSSVRRRQLHGHRPPRTQHPQPRAGQGSAHHAPALDFCSFATPFARYTLLPLQVHICTAPTNSRGLSVCRIGAEFCFFRWFLAFFLGWGRLW
jgi:hypothetical protein